MNRNKPRLYVGLYARGGASVMPGGEDTYHWALLTGPKIETEGGKGMRYHAREKMQPGGQIEWQYEKLPIPLTATNMLLARVLIAKVTDMDKLESILGQVPIRQGQQGWNCVIWVQEALQDLATDGKALGTSQLNWTTVRDAVMSYLQEKKNEHRYDGKGHFDTSKAATFDLLQNVETIP